MCPYEVYDNFFDGKDPDDKLYLLTNGPAQLTDDESDDDLDDLFGISDKDKPNK